MYKVEEFYQLCVIRFFQALFESSTFVGVHLILSQWYTEVELAKRTAIFTSSGLIGNIFSSTLQAAIHKSLDGVNGISGWRWLFIIDFIITVPIAIYGLFFFPDTPKRCKVFYLTPEEVELAASRVPEPTVDRLDWSVFRRVLGRWPWWGFSFLWVLGGENESYATNSLFALYLQYYDYDISARNHYPMGIYALGVVFTFIFAIYIDYTKARYHYRVAIMIALLMIIATALILSGYGNPSYNFAAHYLSGAAYGGQTAFFAWASVVCQDDLQERAVVLGSMNMFSNAVNAWWSILFYSADTVPRFRKGCYAMFGTSFASICVALVIWGLWRRQERNKEIVKDNNPQSPKDQVIVTEKEV